MIQLQNKVVFDSAAINQITDQNLILDSGKVIALTVLELEWILRICGHLIYVNPSLSFNIQSIIALEEQGNNYLVTLRNGFVFQLTKPQTGNLKTKYENLGHKVLDLEARIADLTNKGVVKGDCQKL